MKSVIKKWLPDERAVLTILGLFVFFNWLILVNLEKLASPDYYKFYYVTQNLFSGHLHIKLIPPLFPFLLGLLGKILSFLGIGGDSYIFAGRLISFAAGLGALYFTYLLLKKFVGQSALLATMLLAISPFFLKLLSLPQTDILFLFFVMATFYYILASDFKPTNLWPLLGAILTRFEGVLLLFCTVINFLNKKKRFWLYLSLSLAAGYGILHLFFTNISLTLVKKIEFFFSHKYHLFYLKNPQHLVYLIYDNLLYFISPSLPGFFKWLLFGLFVFFLTAGFYYLFKERRWFAISLVFYLFVFISFKGYMKGVTATQAARRFLSPLWIIFLVAFVGLYYVFKRVRLHRSLFPIVRFSAYAVLAVLSLSLILIKGKSLYLFPLLFLIILYLTFRLPLNRLEMVVVTLVLALFTAQVFYKSNKISSNFVAASANKAGYAVAMWLNQKSENERLALLSNGVMIGYYLTSSRTPPRRFILNKQDRELESEPLLKAFRDQLIGRRIDYVVLDNYLNVQDRPWEAIIKKWLYQQTKIQTHFRLKKTLFYKGQAVAFVLKPIYPAF